MGHSEGPENPSHTTRIDPSSVAHHLRVAADKYYELTRQLLDQMNEAIGAVTAEQKPSYRQARESLAKLFDEQAADAGRLAHLFDDIDQAELVAALESIASANARKVRESRLVAAKVDRAAIPEGRATPACDNELLAAVNSAGENDGSLQHTPTTWEGNEQFNRRVGGGA